MDLVSRIFINSYANQMLFLVSINSMDFSIPVNDHLAEAANPTGRTLTYVSRLIPLWYYPQSTRFARKQVFVLIYRMM